MPGRRDALRSMGALVLALGARELAFGASIVAVRVWPADQYTRVTIESDEALVARHTLIDNPERVVIDIDGLELSPELRELVGKVRADDPFIAGVRVGQNQPRVVRLVIDLKQPTAPQVFTLAPVAAYRNRLVFDLHPTHAPDPLLALLRDKERAVEQAGFAVLKAPDIPSILVETAFISNPEEEARLKDDAYQNQLADAITKGIRRYFAYNPPLAKSRMT